MDGGVKRGEGWRSKRGDDRGVKVDDGVKR